MGKFSFKLFSMRIIVYFVPFCFRLLCFIEVCFVCLWLLDGGLCAAFSLSRSFSLFRIVSQHFGHLSLWTKKSKSASPVCVCVSVCTCLCSLEERGCRQTSLMHTKCRLCVWASRWVWASECGRSKTMVQLQICYDTMNGPLKQMKIVYNIVLSPRVQGAN